MKTITIGELVDCGKWGSYCVITGIDPNTLNKRSRDEKITLSSFLARRLGF